MTPRRTRSGKILSQESIVNPPEGSVARTSGVGSRPRASTTTRSIRVRNTAARRTIAVIDETNVEEEETAVEVIDNNDATAAVVVGEELIVEEAEVIARPNEEENEENLNHVEVTDVEDDPIEILRETVDESVIDLTDDTPDVISPLTLGGHWTNTPSFMARIPPNPMFFTPRPALPPITVDLTDSPVPSANLRLDSTEATTPDPVKATIRELNSTASPSGGGISVQCPVCLESLGSIKRLGLDMVSTVCGHIFCSRCLPASLRASGRCPSCRKRIGEGDYHKLFI